MLASRAQSAVVLLILTLQVNLLHHQLPSPCNERGSGFHAALDGGRATVRYNLQLDGRRPFLAGETRTKE